VHSLKYFSSECGILHSKYFTVLIVNYNDNATITGTGSRSIVMFDILKCHDDVDLVVVAFYYLDVI